jgi:thiamine-phosphate pyrophosphorylase
LKREQLEVYFIMGSQNVKSNDPLVVLEKALQAGVTIFQFREKGAGALTGQAYEDFARACQKLCQKYTIPFIVNDDIELALKLDADGLHIGQDDLSVKEARKRIGEKILGVSVHTMSELEVAIQFDADYVGIGPIYGTKSKDDAKPATGTGFLNQVATNYPSLPIVGIGGITPENTHEVIHAGGDGVAVISAICESEDIQATVQLFKINK